METFAHVVIVFGTGFVLGVGVVAHLAERALSGAIEDLKMARMFHRRTIKHLEIIQRALEVLREEKAK